jgi:hypothetical protein
MAILGQKGTLSEYNFTLDACAPPGADLLEQMEGFEVLMWALTSSDWWADCLIVFKRSWKCDPAGLRRSEDGLALIKFIVQCAIYELHAHMSRPMQYDAHGQPIDLSDGGWHEWFLEESQAEVDARWNRTFLTQDFISLPWYTEFICNTPTTA